MNRRLPRSLLRSLGVSGVALGVIAGARTASAVGKDAIALKMEKDAIYNDYLSTKFEVAEKKIKAALAMCKGSSCSASVIARLHRDLATIYVVGIKRIDEAKKEFVAALRADPDVTLIKDLTTPEIEAYFNEAKGGPSTGSAGADGASADTTAEGTKPAKGGRGASAAAKGDIDHTPPAEQAVSTPLPLYAEMPDGVKISKVAVKIKPFGGEWKTVDMKKFKEGWAVEVPCQDVGSAVGDFKYYIQAFDSTGDLVANNGTKSAPNVVPIRGQLSGDAPHLPGKIAPSACSDGNVDCPPDLPGCSKKKKKHGKPAGEPCDESNECQEGASCTKGLCAEGESGGASSTPEPAKCTTSDDCEGGIACVEGVCGGSRAETKSNWFSLSTQVEFLLMPKSDDACLGTDAAYSCFYGDGTYVDPAATDARQIDPSKGGNKVSGGITRGTARFLIGYDRVLVKNLQVGGRLGFAFLGEPSSPQTKGFVPFHFEARGAYFFGSQPFQKKSGFRFFVAGAGGIAEVDAPVAISIYQAGWGDPTTVNAWHKTGTGFFSLGGGGHWILGASHAISLEVRWMQLLGTSGTAFGLGLGYLFGI